MGHAMLDSKHVPHAILIASTHVLQIINALDHHSAQEEVNATMGCALVQLDGVAHLVILKVRDLVQ